MFVFKSAINKLFWKDFLIKLDKHALHYGYSRYKNLNVEGHFLGQNEQYQFQEGTIFVDEMFKWIHFQLKTWQLTFNFWVFWFGKIGQIS